MGAVNEKNGQVQLIFDLDVFALRMRKAFGYVGDIKLIESHGGDLGRAAAGGMANKIFSSDLIYGVSYPFGTGRVELKRKTVGRIVVCNLFLPKLLLRPLVV